MVVGTEDDLQFVLVYTVQDCVKATLGVIRVICTSILTNGYTLFIYSTQKNEFLNDRYLRDVVWNFGHSILMHHQKITINNVQRVPIR